jgi:hypothetical protein
MNAKNHFRVSVSWQRGRGLPIISVETDRPWAGVAALLALALCWVAVVAIRHG